MPAWRSRRRSCSWSRSWSGSGRWGYGYECSDAVLGEPWTLNAFRMFSPLDIARSGHYNALVCVSVFDMVLFSIFSIQLMSTARLLSLSHPDDAVSAA